MDTLNINGTEDTPSVTLDKSKGVFEISGRSLPEDAAGFFKPVLSWIEAYKEQSNPATNLQVKLEYFNTASSKLILDILTKFEKIQGAKIIWYHFSDDEDMKEAGQEFSELVEIPFEFKSM
ncbi:DUF1987 domain-containing protein [Sporocytophaga myxococcoides]|uniref:DUF1987 domain-containing protein n=1 Tax=Sporocytophaga myxococcoides TaxID=153721 RepID=UPI00041BECE1|nr:DUF1987 domain-containing protein [Sporocytophaga myxococcoides]